MSGLQFALEVETVAEIPEGEPRTILDRMWGTRLYTLDDDNRPHGTFDVEGWRRWMMDSSQLELRHRLRDAITVTTRFTGIDFMWAIGWPPLLWETVVVGGSHDGYKARSASYGESRVTHARVLDLVQQGANG